MTEARTADLWLKIDQLHLRFLQAEETPAKLELRNKLEGLVAEYLSLVPHDRKFVSISTGDLITNSIKWRPEFSLAKAANAFRAVEQYAANLINQPWRQEFWKIRQYSGFYKHSVETALSGADKLFLEMGYNATSNQVLELPAPRDGQHPVNIDAVTCVARDCVLACVECSLLAEIQTGVSGSGLPVELAEVAEFRRDHIGPVDQAVRELTYRKSQQRSQTFYPPLSSTGSAPYHPLAYGAYMAPSAQTNGYAPHLFPPSQANGFTGPVPGFGVLTPPTQNGFDPNGVFPPPNGGVVPSAYSPNGGVAGGFSPNGGGLVALHSPPGGAGFPAFGGSPQHQQQQGQHVIPARVAEESRLPTGHSPAGSSSSTLRGGQIPTTILELTSQDREPAPPERRGRGGEGGARPREGRSKGRQSGGDQQGGQGLESWDYVYRQLETQGYTKDQAERPDVLTRGQEGRESQEREEDRRRRDLDEERRKREVAEEEEVRRGLGGIRLQQQQQQGRDRGDGVHHRSVKAEAGGRGRGRHSRNLETSESEEHSKYSSAVESDEPAGEKMDWGRAVRRGPGPAPQQASRGGGGGTRSQGGAMWECSTCTFHNAEGKQICDMCSKSRDGIRQELAPPAVVRKEKSRSPTPPATGIKCDRCTLVNQPNARICAACDSTLGAPLV